jgi:hypothetical protein
VRHVHRIRSAPVFVLLGVLLAQSAPALAQTAPPPADEPPVIPIGHDAFLQWDRWPYLRIGVRAYMKSTFDRTGGNHTADAAHFIRQLDDDLNIALDETGPGILWFVRHNHWHGSPWHYRVDGRTTVVEETSTADPVNPVPNSVFLPESAFPAGLTWTWSVTKGADLSWVPIAFEDSFRLGYGRARYGTGYFIYWKLMPGLSNLSRPLRSWTPEDEPPTAVLDLLARSGTDIAPQGDGVAEKSGRFDLAPYETRLLFRAAGDGSRTIRRLAFRVPEASAAALAGARLRIYWDDRPAPSVDAPLGLFFGTGSLLHTPEQEYIVRSFPMTVKRENGEFLFASYFPMPYHRSVRIEVAETGGERIAGASWAVRHLRFDDPPNTVGLFHATYRDIPTPRPGHDLVLLDTRETEGGGPWSGHLVGTTYLFTKTGTLRTLEGDPRFYFDDSLSPQAQGTGSEEWGGGGDYWGGLTMTLPFAGHPVGRPEDEALTPLDRVHSAYRFLLSDLMPFGRNARITLEHGGENQSTEHYETVTYWYGIDSPSLVLTDELDVGDLEDEARHAYVSPAASAVDTLTTRHELGVDHVTLEGGGRMQVYPPIADDGRRTATASEFTVTVRPDNLGLLLRRRLDLAYPDQRARVLVAEADDPRAEWREAGVWYTAGGNTVVYADPRAIPSEQRTVHDEIAPPARVLETSNRRWRDDEFMIPRALTEGRDRVRIRLEHLPLREAPVVAGLADPERAWTEYRYWIYSFVMPEAPGRRAAFR